MAKYQLRLLFDWHAGGLWSGNDASYAKFDHGLIDDQLNLPDYLQGKIYAMTAWHDTALDWSYPPDPSPWAKETFEAFDREAEILLKELQEHLGPEFDLTYETVGEWDPDAKPKPQVEIKVVELPIPWWVRMLSGKKK